MAVICFDLDNTLIYSMNAYYLALNYALKELGLKEISRNKFSEYFGRSNKLLLRDVFSDITPKELNEILRLRTKFFFEKTIKYVKLIPNVKRTLNELGKYHILVLLSNSEHKKVSRIFKKLKINSKIFKLIFGADDVGVEKPSTLGIRKIQKLLNKKVDYIVGDTPTDIITGNRAKIKSIGVLTGAWSREKLKKYKPFKIIKSVNQLSEVI